MSNPFIEAIHNRLRTDPAFAIQAYEYLASKVETMAAALEEAKRGLAMWNMDYEYIDKALGIPHEPKLQQAPQLGSCGMVPAKANN